MKKWLAYLLMLALTLSLFGCSMHPSDPTATGQSPSGTTTAPAPTGTTNNEDPLAALPPARFSLLPDDSKGSGYSTTAAISTRTLPHTLDNPDNLPVLTWVCLVDNGHGTTTNRRWSSAPVEELNQMLAERSMPFRIQFKLVSSTSSSNDWFARSNIHSLISGADLIYGSADQQELPNWFAPITQYITGDSALNLANSVGHEKDWRKTTVGKEIYGIPAEPVLAEGNGWWIDTEFMEKCGLTVEDFSRNFWEMDEIFAIMYKQNNNKPFLYCEGDGGGFETQGTKHGILKALPMGGIVDAIDRTNHQTIGGSFGIDLTGEKPVVVDILATDLVRNIQQAILRYQKAGYVTSDYALDKLRYDQTYGSGPYEDSGKTMVPIAQTTDCALKKMHVTGISKDSPYLQEAAALLELIAEDEEFRMQLFYGKEGRDYEIVDGLYSLIPQADKSTYSLDFLSPLAWFSGFVSEGDTEYSLSPSTNSLYFAHIGKTPLESYRDNMEALRYCWYPVVFDYSGYEKELENISRVMGRYYYVFQGMTEDTYDEMLELMELAGSKKVMAALQQQLDAWIADNPDWDPLG